MTKLEALEALKAKVEAGNGPTFDLLHTCFGGRWHTFSRAYKGSLDAAMALHNAVLPGWQLVVDFSGNHAGASVSSFGCIQSSDNAIPARAWLLAILSALIEQEKEATKTTDLAK